MMATAFEVLLEVPEEEGKSDWIAKAVGRRCATSDAIMDIAEEGRRRRSVARPRVARWAYDFYRLRCDIVHGDEVPASRLTYPCAGLPWMTHRIVADLLYWELMTRELFSLRCLGSDIRSHAAELHARLFDSCKGDRSCPQARTPAYSGITYRRKPKSAPNAVFNVHPDPALLE
jgi:hypothetical protein